MDMLKQGHKVDSNVFGCHIAMIKNLVVSSIDSDQERLKFINAFKSSKDDESMSKSENSDESMSSSEEQDEEP